LRVAERVKERSLKDGGDSIELVCAGRNARDGKSNAVGESTVADEVCGNKAGDRKSDAEAVEDAK